MNRLLLKYVGKRPKPYEVTGLKFWDDPHISKGMFAAHLNTELESATRKLNFIKKSVNSSGSFMSLNLKPLLSSNPLISEI